ncbi:histidine phosphatase family protein [Dactylosporangium sp. CA-092794]|uniref:histidine phosphatase family protein n=1 Tax=Dactylosporangium sp. CA-092794 TaxID=3239929 RepID=UPI003D8A030E
MGLAALAIVRHGQSEANAAFAAAAAAGRLDSGITGRDADVPLTRLGQAQLAMLGAWLAEQSADERPQVVVCSPFRRAVQSWQAARAAAEARGVRLPDATVDARLGDRHMGELELMTAAAIAARFPAEAARRAREGEFGYRPPGGESFQDIAGRLSAALADLDRDHPGQRVWLIAHDAVVLTARFVLEPLSVAELVAVMAAGAVENGSVTRFHRDEGVLRLTEYNIVRHLTGLATDSRRQQ